MNLCSIQRAVQAIPRSGDTKCFGRTGSQKAILEPLMAKLGAAPIRVDDLTDTLRLRSGRIYAVRWDITAGEVGFKQPVMAALLLFHLWRRRSDASSIQALVDGGNVNTCLALSCLAAHFGVRAEHVLSRHFPQDIRDYMRTHGHGCLNLVEAPPAALGKEREFYTFLLDSMRDRERRRTHLCLWHAKYSGIATRWMGEAFANAWSHEPDDIVLGLGSGSTLEGYAMPIKERFGAKPRIVIAEHQQSRLVCDASKVENLSPTGEKDSAFTAEFRRPPAAVPHMVLGPHYDDVNPLLSAATMEQVDAVIRYSDIDWQDMSHFCRVAGMPIGNSSAANLAVACHLAKMGRKVFTFLYEPLREFYIQRPSLNGVKRPGPFRTVKVG